MIWNMELEFRDVERLVNIYIITKKLFGLRESHLFTSKKLSINRINGCQTPPILISYTTNWEGDVTVNLLVELEIYL